MANNTNPAVFTQFAMPDPNVAPLNLTQLFQLANRLVSSEIDPQSNYRPYVVSSAPPHADDHDKVWIALDSQQRPVALKVFWHGRWRRVYNGMLGEIRGFSGDPGYSAGGNFDIHGLGNLEGEYDGWHLCNGQDGTPDLSNQFVCGANMNNNGSASGWDPDKGGWVTFIDSNVGTTHGGGLWTTELKPDNIPFPAKPAMVNIDRWRWDDATRDPTLGKLYGKPDASVDESLVPADPGNPTPVPIFTAPPFYTLAWMIFVGYQS